MYIIGQFDTNICVKLANDVHAGIGLEKYSMQLYNICIVFVSVMLYIMVVTLVRSLIQLSSEYMYPVAIAARIAGAAWLWTYLPSMQMLIPFHLI